MSREVLAAAYEALRTGQMEDADRLCRAVLALDPQSASFQANLGLALKKSGHLKAAAASCRRALVLAPAHPQIHNNLGSAWQEAGMVDQAAECYRTSIILAPGSPGPYHNLGSLLRDQGRLDQGLASFRRALWIEPRHPDLHDGLATLEQYRERLDVAIPSYRRAIALQPERADFYNNFGNGLLQDGQVAPAELVYRRALALAPEHADACFNLSLVFLLTGRLRQGWPGYERRWQTRQLSHERRDFPQPLWQGQASPGRTLLLHGEQGFGDILQFCRYAPLARAKGVRIVLEVPAALRRLLDGPAGCDLVVTRGDPLPPFDFHCPLLSLPLMLGTQSLADIPASIPYIRPETALTALWAKRLGARSDGRPRVGLVWAGAPRSDSPAQAAFDRRRSLPPAALARLLAIPGLCFFSLQKGIVAGPGLIDFMAEMTDFADTAALIANLDLVISVDTAVAHLAGAIGKTVWLLNRFDTDWRWLTERDDTPWYPTMRIFRQRLRGDWNGVIDDVAQALAAL
jgi:Tfp pilus assembly protein PilF